MIDSFVGDFAFLSNFYKKKMVWEGITYPTSEHAFQAAKSLDVGFRTAVSMAETPTLAKRMGRAVLLRPDWEEVKIPVMRSVLERKFRDGNVLAGKLIATRDHLLIEGNGWGDRFWGVCRGEGQNWLGILLMARRAELRGR